LHEKQVASGPDRFRIGRLGVIAGFIFVDMLFRHVVIPFEAHTRSPTHKSQPDAGGGELDEREVVGVVLFEASGDSSEVLHLVEEALDEISEAMKKAAEGRDVDAPGHGFDVGPGSTCSDALAQGVAVVGTIAKQDLALAKGVEQVSSALSIVSLAFGDLQGDWIAVGVHQSMDLGCQSAPRAPHASGSRVVPSGGAGALLLPPFLPLAAC